MTRDTRGAMVQIMAEARSHGLAIDREKEQRMAILRIVEVGTATAQAAIDSTAAAGGDSDAIVLRVGVLAFLNAHAATLSAGDDAALLDVLDAYRAWLEIAIQIYSTGDETLVGDYMERATAVTTEMERAATRCHEGLEA